MKHATYCELHCKTNFSFLQGASNGDELAARGAELGYGALAVTDRNTLAGVVRAHVAAKEAGIKLIVGAEIAPIDGPRALLWAIDRDGYASISRLITIGRRRGAKGHCELRWEELAELGAGVLLGVVPGSDGVTDEADIGEATQLDRLHEFRDRFGDRAYLIAELHHGPDDGAKLEGLARLSRETRLPLVAAGDVHYHARSRQPLFEVLTATRLGTTVAELHGTRFANAERHLRTIGELQTAFAGRPDALARTQEIAARCTFSLDELRYEYPEELAPAGRTPIEYLTELAWRGAEKRYPHGVPARVSELIGHELRLIADLRYEAYFLTVFDLVRFARHRGILCQGRGSAANSAVCYCLGITSVDPDQADVLFERFVSRERNEAPDIDVDFEHERREEVLQYVYEKYGRERAGMTAVVITYRARSAVRDVGRALGLSLDVIDRLAKQVEGYAHEPLLDERCRQAGLDPDSELGRRFTHLVRELIGFPRHLSQHVGGMVITQRPLDELTPIENAAMPGRTVIEWDKDDLDELGILKVDCLSLGMLTAIRKCFALVERHHGRRLTLASVPPDDRSVYDMICRADTMGVFQIESRAQMSMLPRLQPRCFYDLVIEVAIVRPGPIQGNMVHPYLRRRARDEPVTYPNDAIRDVLHKTLGVPIFQEQAMRLAVVAAGFTPGEADQLRRAMGAWRRPGVIDNFRRKLLDGMQSRGLSREFAEQVFQQIRGFGEYGFPESHAASFALLVYVSAYLKRYYPAAYCAAILNSQPMGFYAPAQLVQNARDHGVAVRPIDVNFSEWDCTLEEAATSGDRPIASGERDERASAAQADAPPADDPASAAGPALRLGLRLLRGMPVAAAERLMGARADGRFATLDDFTRRTRFGRALIARLAEADAFGSLERDRRAALWESLAQEKRPQPTPLFDHLEEDSGDRAAAAELPPLTAEQEVHADYLTAGLSLRAHPISFHRAALDRLGILAADRLLRLSHGRRVRVAGIVLLRQRPSTAKGITFVTLEDETGTINLVVRQTIWQRFYAVARTSPAWIAHGRLERKGPVIHVVCDRLEDMSTQLGDLQTRSRDFR